MDEQRPSPSWGNLNEAIKRAVPGGAPVEVKDEKGKVVGFCGICEPGDNPLTGVIKWLLKDCPDLQEEPLKE